MDINLLNDTKRDDEKKKSAPLPVDPELTDPTRLPKSSAEPKTPSRFSSWLKTLRSESTLESARKLEKSQPDLNIPDVVVPKSPNIPRAEDIFEELEQPTVTPKVVPPTDFSQQPIEKANVVSAPAKPLPRKIPPIVPPAEERPPKVKPVKQKAEAPKKDRNDVDRGSLVNLIPSEFRQSIDPRSKLLGLGLTVLGCVVVLGGTFALLTFYRTSILEKIQKLRAERATVEQSISQLRPRQREALATNNRLKIISSLLDQHIYWTKFFEKLEQYTIDDVYFTGTLSGSLDGQMTLSAVGSSYTSPARQLLVLEKASDFVTNVAITSASAVQNSSANLPPGSVAASEVSFSITITLVPDIFTYSADSFPFDRRGTASPENPSIDPLNPFGLPVGGNTQPQSGNSNTNQAIPGNTNLNPTQ